MISVGSDNNEFLNSVVSDFHEFRKLFTHELVHSLFGNSREINRYVTTEHEPLGAACSFTKVTKLVTFKKS